jgi:hypothetical protein
LLSIHQIVIYAGIDVSRGNTVCKREGEN